MRLKFRSWVGGLCAVCLGCSPVAHTIRTVIVEPTEYSFRIDACVEDHRNRVLADAAWEQFRAGAPDVAFSFDFERGFKDGYADYLFAGGSAKPPPLPPRVYWKPEYKNPVGHKAIDDWFNGFHRGATAARASGYRGLVTVPASTALPPGSGRAQLPRPVPPRPVPPPERDHQAPPASREVLPPPRELPPGAAPRPEDRREENSRPVAPLTPQAGRPAVGVPGDGAADAILFPPVWGMLDLDDELVEDMPLRGADAVVFCGLLQATLVPDPQQPVGADDPVVYRRLMQETLGPP